MVARDTPASFEHLRCESAMFTNGSGRTASFWADLAKIASHVRFSIDGLEDTNHLERRGTPSLRIMASVTVFIAAGGRAERADEACRVDGAAPM